MDIDTRLLRYFAAVAEEGNLTYAAQRLFVAQPTLTKQIKQLESRLGVELFTRSRAGMALTEPGRTLAERVPALLADWDQVLRATKSTANRAARVLRVGFLASAANEATPRIIAEFTRRQPGWKVDMRQAAWSNPTAGLSAGDVDAAVLRLPFPGQDALRVEVLFTEPRWVALPATHPFAARDRIPFADLWDEPFVAAPPETGGWRDYWLATDERDGRPVRIGAVTEHPDDWLSAIANGYGIALAPESSARFYARPGITYRPVSGVSPSQVGVAWAPADDADPVVQAFVRCCLNSRQPQHDETIPSDDGRAASPGSWTPGDEARFDRG
ncbi:LysR family transcriptional regulator [Streptomyces sp. P1-3]|uniref:LysR family transcriptional regulator n=1 Tax=Streptomyces sp. P1-3 TaxID=3421658 RepID=UPI003D36BB91